MSVSYCEKIVFVGPEDDLRRIYELLKATDSELDDHWWQAFDGNNGGFYGRFTSLILRHGKLWTIFDGGRHCVSGRDSIDLIANTFPTVKAYRSICDGRDDTAYTDDRNRQYFKRYMIEWCKPEYASRLCEEHPEGFDSTDEILSILNDVSGRNAKSIDDYFPPFGYHGEWDYDVTFKEVELPYTTTWALFIGPEESLERLIKLLEYCAPMPFDCAPFDEKFEDECLTENIAGLAEEFKRSKQSVIINWEMRPEGLFVVLDSSEKVDGSKHDIAFIQKFLPNIRAYYAIRDLGGGFHTNDTEHVYFKKYLLTDANPRKIFYEEVKQNYPGGFESMDEILAFINEKTGKNAQSMEEYDWSFIPGEDFQIEQLYR